MRSSNPTDVRGEGCVYNSQVSARFRLADIGGFVRPLHLERTAVSYAKQCRMLCQNTACFVLQQFASAASASRLDHPSVQLSYHEAPCACRSDCDEDLYFGFEDHGSESGRPTPSHVNTCCGWPSQGQVPNSCLEVWSGAR